MGFPSTFPCVVQGEAEKEMLSSGVKVQGTHAYQSTLETQSPTPKSASSRAALTQHLA